VRRRLLAGATTPNNVLRASRRRRASDLIHTIFSHFAIGDANALCSNANDDYYAALGDGIDLWVTELASLLISPSWTA
jgi:hypothetical protein